MMPKLNTEAVDTLFRYAAIDAECCAAIGSKHGWQLVGIEALSLTALQVDCVFAGCCESFKSSSSTENTVAGNA